MFTNKNASDYIKEIQSRVLYANYRLQRDRVDGGCASRVKLESGSAADNASSTYTDIMTGAVFTTAETLSTIQASGCVSAGGGAGDCAYSGTVPTIESFTSVGTFSWTAPCSVTSVTYLVVGGGGGGGAASGTGSGGGGAGGSVKTGTLSVTPGTIYSYTVGAGGDGGLGNSSGEASGEDGELSAFATITAAGGGKGFRSRSTNETGTLCKAGAAQVGDTAPTGGSGGGTRNNDAGGGPGGGLGGGGGGGGGAGGAGSDGSDSSPGNQTFADGGAGGAGISSSISGSSVTYGAGGNGGDESFTNLAGTAGAANTGEGGGGAMTTSMGGAGASGGAGGSGIVIISYNL